jgi:UDPglucose 6-dehydrogenase
VKIGMIGAGYVGLVAGTCFAEMGHNVIVVDIDPTKIDTLRAGETPFYEPGLNDLLERNIREKRLSFTTQLTEAVHSAKVVFIAVQTPQGEDGSADLSTVLSVARQIGQAMIGPLVVVTKSTVPVGTASKVQQAIEAVTQHAVSVVSNPEFLKEGAAVDDFLRPDRVVIGTNSEETRRLMADLYAPFIRTGNPIFFMDNASAEMVKYTANGLLAARISFMNEIAMLCDKVGADVDLVRLGVGSDKRIGHAFLFPGIGYGGSCFPKDVRALINTGREHNMQMEMLVATDRVNERQKHYLSAKIIARFGPKLSGCTFAIWGLAFKPKTDDVREAPALTIVEDLLHAGAAIRVYDPEGMNNARSQLGKRVTYCQSNYEACEGADALVVVTEWNEFRRPDFERIKALLKQAIVFDGRNIYDPVRMRDYGFEHLCIGRNQLI